MGPERAYMYVSKVTLSKLLISLDSLGIFDVDIEQRLRNPANAHAHFVHRAKIAQKYTYT